MRTRGRTATDRASVGPTVAPVVASLAIAVLVAAVALPSSTSTPPAVAEVSPRADAPPESPSPEQPSAIGGVGADPARPAATTAPTPDAPESSTATTSTTTTTLAPARDAARRRCVPNGDGTARQTEDPQSPPCVAGSAFDATTNGGATADGVTADTVTIAVTASVPNVDERMLAALESHFNERYEFHGRRLDLVRNSDLNYSQGPSIADIVAEAVRADEEIGAFAATGFAVTGPGEDVFYDELARRGVVGVSFLGSAATTAELAAQRPYRYALQPGFDRRIAAYGDWLCTAWAGGAPDLAGAGVVGADRRIGLVYATGPDGSEPDLSPLVTRLDGCGLAPVARAAVAWDDGFDSTGGYLPSADTTRVISEFRAAGVTTVLSQANMITELGLWTTASNARYQPEWVFGAYNYPNSSRIWVHPARDQHDRTFLLTPQNRILGPDASPMFAVMEQVDPSLDMTYSVELYQAILVLASGIQHAGPDLTPTSLAAALDGLAWANTGVTAPFFQASVGFASSDPSWSDDVAIAWWDSTEPAPEDGSTPGALCFLDDGRRFRPGQFPSSTDTLGVGC